MYIIEYDGKLVHDVRTEIERVTDASCSLEANTSGSLEFTMAPNHPLYGLMATMDTSHEMVLYQADSDGTITSEVFRGRITEDGEDIKTRTDITCEGQLAYLADSIVRPYGTYADTTNTPAEWTTIAPGNAHEYAEWLIAQHNKQTDATKQFAIGRNQLPDTSITRSSTEYPTTLSEIKDKVLTDLGCYIVAYWQDGTRYVDFLTDGGADCTQSIEFGENLLDYSTSRDLTSLYTAIIPIGKTSGNNSTAFGVEGYTDGPVPGHDGCSKHGDMIMYEPGVTKCGIICKKVSYDDCATLDGLVSACCDDLTDLSDATQSLSISAADLSHIDPTIGTISLLEWVKVISPPHNVDESILCLKIAIDINDPTNTKYTLGATLPTLTSSNVLSEATQRTEQLNAIEKVNAISAASKETAITALNTANAAVASVQEQYYLSTSSDEPTGGEWSYDRPEWASGQWIWTRSLITKGDGTQSTSQAVCVTGNTGGGIDSVDIYYYLSDSTTELIGGEWTTNYPGWQSGKYLWSKTVTTLSDGTSTVSGSACITGSSGDDAITVQLTSDNGATFKNGLAGSNAEVTVWHGTAEISNITSLRSEFGSSAKLVWNEKSDTDEAFTPLASDDSRISDAGFKLAVTAADVHNRLIFKCNVEF